MAAQTDDGFSQFDELLKQRDTSSSPWAGSSYLPDLDLLSSMLSIPIAQGDKQESGRPAKAFDAWVAHELRRAGFPSESVWPRTSRPRVLADGLGTMEGKIEELARQLDEAERDGGRLKPAGLRRAIRGVTQQPLGSASAYVLGDFYSKQVDVGLSSWQRGPDILISTKTMFSAYGKNLKNRHEEAVGEVASLRRRHPMAAMGYAYLVRDDILEQPSAYATLYDILSRLRRNRETFDATLLLMVKWDDADPAAGVQFDQPAPDLNVARFFEDLVEATLDRSPSREHQEVRRRRGGMPIGGLAPEEEEELEDLEAVDE